MRYIVYVSQTKKPFSEDELLKLLKHSRQRNTKESITGLLVYRFNEDYDRGNFIQVLEGPEKQLEDVWSRISKDPRHHTIVVVEEGHIQERMFKDWSMGFKNVDSKDLCSFQGFSDLGSDKFWEDIDPGKVSSALELARSFYYTD